MPKKISDGTKILIATIASVLIVLAVLIYGGTQGWFKLNFSFTSNLGSDILDRLNNEPAKQAECTASLSQTTINFGGSVTGTIKDGSNTLCEVYGKMVGTDDWRKVAEGRTDMNGLLTYTDTISVEGAFDFRVICGTCITNTVRLVVNPAPATTSCRDTDGKNKMTAGFVQDSSGTYYDDCAGNWAVTEYWCNGDVMASQVIACDAGYICFETRGGDYCRLIDDTPAPEPTTSYTCGGFLRWCSGGTCPTNYYCQEVNQLATTSCACVDRLGNVNPDWLLGGQYYIRK